MNREKTPIWLALAFLVLSAPALAQDYGIYLVLDINKNLEITGYNLAVSNAQPDEIGYGTVPWNASVPGIMRLDLLKQDGMVLSSYGFYPDFLLLSDPPQELNETAVLLVLPYGQGDRYLKVYSPAGEELSLDLQQELCNGNGKCDRSENYYSCPKDCSLNSRDGVCAGVSYDGGCDPDCPARLDLDCSCPNRVCEEWENYGNCQRDCPSGGNDSYCDGIKDGKCDPDCSLREDIDCTCPDRICQLFESRESCPQDCPLGSQGEAEWPEGGLWIYLLAASGIAAVAILVLVKSSRQRERYKWKPLLTK